jgi:hypothetical protein
MTLSLAVANDAAPDAAANPFAPYGIDHLSPSTCNTFAASPALFVLQKCMKLKTPVGAAAHRGTSVETGVAFGLNDLSASVDTCVQVAMDQFRTLTATNTDPRREKEEASIAGFVATGLAELRPYGKPTALQGSVSLPVPGCAVPIIGFCDFEWEHLGVGTDLKTTHACPSEISLTHARQVSLYKVARGWKEARVSYVTPKKSATYKLENSEQHLEVLFRICRAIQNFVALSPDPKFLASIVVPDVDSFYFNDALARQNAYEVYGI